MKPINLPCHKVLPLVYDNSLSYYEQLCKVAAAVDETVETVTQLAETYQEIVDFYEHIQEDIDAAIDQVLPLRNILLLGHGVLLDTKRAAG